MHEDSTPPELRCVRAFPERSRPATVDPLPASLSELRALTDGGQVPGLDLFIHEQRSIGEVSAWTNNPDAELEFFAFGCDGRGSIVALWLLHEGPLERQPVVFLGSEGDGDVRPISTDLAGMLELMAAGVDPATEDQVAPVAGAAEIVARHFPGRPTRTAAEILDQAQELRDIEHRVMVQLNRHE